MPHLTLQITPLGPVMDVLVGVSRPRAAALTQAGQPIPNPVAVRGLVDTGASCTCIDPGVLTSLNLTPTGSQPVHTPSTQGTPVNQLQYDVSLILPHPGISYSFHSLAVIQSQLAVQGIQGLIGRDVLDRCLLVYDGPLGAFTLAF